MNKILITICARSGSKGIPGKNIKLMDGKPLLAYTIDVAMKFSKLHNADIALSTDSLDIVKVAAEWGLKTDYVRPAELATDTAGKIPVIKDVLLYQEKTNNIKYDFILDLDVTAPFRDIKDLEAGYEILLNDKNAINLFSVSKSHRNPYFNMVEIQENGYYDLVKKGTFTNRQAAPKVYDVNASFYFYRRFFFDTYNLAITPRTLIYEVPHLCFDLDHPVDFDFMEYLIVNKKLDFEL